MASMATKPVLSSSPAHAAASPGHGEGAHTPAPPSTRDVAVAAVVQFAMLLFGVSRNFLKFGFESAMVVVYDRQLFFSPGASGLIAGGCALSTVASLMLYRAYCARHVGTHRLLLIAEAFGLGSAALMIATEATLLMGGSGVPLSAAASLSRRDYGDLAWPAELLTLGA